MAKVKLVPRTFGEIPAIVCPECKRVLREKVSKTIIRMPYCGKCGRRIEDAAHNFCGNCGEKVEWDE